MTRPPLEVADLVRSAGTAFIERNRQWLRWTHIKVLLAIARCRTAALGGHIDECTRCGHRTAISYNSCRNRHCPKCQTGARERWLQARRSELLPTPYVHVVFTLPPQLASLALQNKKVIYGLLLRASAETLLDVARDPRHLGAEIGFFSVLHTWNQKLQLHPHVHCVFPLAGSRSIAHAGFSLAHASSSPSRARRVFRGKFVAGLKSGLRSAVSCTFPEICITRSPEDLRLLAASAVSERLDRLLQTTLRWSRVRAPLSRPLYPSRRHLQPPPGFLWRMTKSPFAGATPLTTIDRS